MTVQAHPATRMSPSHVRTIEESSVSPTNGNHGNRPHAEMSNLSAYQSHAIVSRQKATGVKNKHSLRSIGAQATFTTDKTVS